MYEKPTIGSSTPEPSLEENAFIWALLAFVVVIYGSAAAFCIAVCGGPSQVRSCDTGWFPPKVRAACR